MRPPYNTISFTIRPQSGELWYIVVDNSHELQAMIRKDHSSEVEKVRRWGEDSRESHHFD